MDNIANTHDSSANKALDAFIASLNHWYKRAEDKPAGLEVLIAGFEALPDDLQETGQDAWTVFKQVIEIKPWSRHLVYEQMVAILAAFGLDEDYINPRVDVWPDLDDLPPLQLAQIELLEAGARALRHKLTGRETRERFNTRRNWQIAALTLFFVLAAFGGYALDRPTQPRPDVDLLVEARPQQFWRVTVRRQHKPDGLDADFLEMLNGVSLGKTGVLLVTEQQ